MIREAVALHDEAVPGHGHLHVRLVQQVGLFEALRDKDLSLAESIWQAKFEKAKERYLGLLANEVPEGASR